MQETDEQYRERRAKEWREFLERMNNPQMVARRGTVLTPYGWRKPSELAPSTTARPFRDYVTKAVEMSGINN